MAKKIYSKANALEFKKSAVILTSMVVKNVKNQYRRSVLGILWTVLNPLLTMLVMAFVFSSIFGRNAIAMDYPVYVLSGNVVFSLFRGATTAALPSMVDNYDLLTKTRVPYSVFPVSQVFSAVVTFLFSLIALVIVMLVRMRAGVQFFATMPMILFPWLPSITLFSAGIALVLCSIYVRFRDIKHLYSVLLTLWMYLTPVFYSVTILPGYVQDILKFNPMMHYLEYFREVLVGIVPSWQEHVICYGMGLVSVLFGWLVFRSQRKKFVLYI